MMLIDNRPLPILEYYYRGGRNKFTGKQKYRLPRLPRLHFGYECKTEPIQQKPKCSHINFHGINPFGDSGYHSGQLLMSSGSRLNQLFLASMFQDSDTGKKK